MDSQTRPPVGDRTLIDALRRRLEAETGHPVELVETHISWVLLTERLAYKLKKPVRLPFVDFGTLAQRRHFCDEELRLNRRLAPSLYLDVVAVRGSAQAPRLDGPGEPIEYAVRMRRFPRGALLSERLEAHVLLPEHLDGLARRLAAFHRDAAPAPPTHDAKGAVLAPVLGVLAQLRAPGVDVRVDALTAWFTAQARSLHAAWAERERDGHVRECHGDLHLANTVMLDGEATAFDCIEFDPALRCTDVMADVGFLTMDLKAHGRADLAFDFLDRWLQASGDYDGLRVLRFYETYRALVRALVGRLRAGTGATDYLACAERLVRADARAPRLLITHGLSGSGKSTLARELLAAAGAVRVRSDVERKRLFGLEALERSAGRVEIYGAEATARTFERLADCARTALRAGYAVIVDAAFLRRAEREVMRTLAAELRVPFTILHCRAADARLCERIAARNAGGADASEADLGVLARQRRSAEPLSEAERGDTIDVDTDAAVDTAALWGRWRAAGQRVAAAAP